MTSGLDYLLLPLLALIFVGLLVLACRWAFASGTSLVTKSDKPGHVDDYGLLSAIASPPTYIEGEILRRTLEQAGIRATLAHTLEGPRIMVFAKDVEAARSIIRAGRGPARG